MRKIVFGCMLSLTALAAHSQLMVSKLIGKNSANSKLGYGTFCYLDIPLNPNANNSVRIELLDLALFPPIDKDIYTTTGYISVKLGYKKVFSDSRTGFYLEPQAGYARVVTYQSDRNSESLYKDGFAIALEPGYSLEVGERGHSLNFGLKYETDMAGTHYKATSIGLRFSYSFHVLGRKDSYY